MKLSFTPLCILGGAIALISAPFVIAEEEKDTIFISAKAPIKAEEFSGSVSVVTAQQIKARGATSVAEALETLPGISIGATGNNSGKEIRIRGMSAEYALFLIDGKRIPNAERNISSSPANRNRWVAIENIQRIEVIRGAASSLYGSDALSGVINIITKKPTKEWQSSVTLNGRSFKRSGGEGSGINISTAGALSERVRMGFSVDHQDDNIIEDNAGLSILSKRRVTNSKLDLSVDVNAESTLDLGVIYGEENALDTDISRGGGRVENELVQIKRLFSAGYTTKIGEFNSLFSLSNGNSSIKEGSNDWQVQDNNISLDVDGAITDAQYISAGIGYRVEKANRYDRDFSDTFKSSNAFIQDVIDLNDDHSLTLGLSFENHNNYGSEFSPKVYWNWALDDNWAIKAGYSEGRVAPAIREGSSAYVIPGGRTRIYKGNDNLKPEESKTLELSASYDAQALTATVAVFNTQIDNLITTKDFVDNGITTALYSNVNKSRIRGLEGSIAWDVSQKSNLSFNYTYLDVENRSGDNRGKQIIRRPNHQANLTFDHQLSAIDSQLSVAWKGLSSQYTDAVNSEEIRGYGLVDVGLVKDIAENLSLSGVIKNIADNRLMDGDEAITIGREYRISLTARF